MSTGFALHPKSLDGERVTRWLGSLTIARSPQQPKFDAGAGQHRGVTPDRPDLPRVLNLSHATAIVVGTIIGSGIFLVPQEMMQAVGSSTLVYLAWIAGGLLTLCGAMTYAELGAMRPEAGGEYVYLRDAYGDMAAFFYMWTWFAVAKPASIASVTTGFVRTLELFPALHFLTRPAIDRPFEVLWSQLLAIAATWFVTGLNYLGMRKAGDFQLVFTWLKVALIFAVVGICFFGVPHAGSTSGWSNYASHFAGATGGFTGFMIALIAALWAYDGWNDLSMVGGEVRSPQRNLPLALVGGVVIVGVLFMGTNAAIQYVLPADAIAAAPRPALAALSRITGPWGAALLTAGMALSILVGLNGTVMSGARVPFASARDGLFFRQIAHINPRFRSPSTSLVVQGLLSTMLLLAVARFQQLFELAIFSEWLFYMLAATTVFAFRRREPDAPRPYRVPGYPVLPALFVLASAVLLCYSYISNLRNSLIGTVVILLGLPLFLHFRKTAATKPAGEA